MKNKCYILIGPPASGKSTWRSQQQGDFVIISGDDIVDEIALKEGKTYGEVWPTIDHDAVNRTLHEKVKMAISEKKDLIVDRTNMTPKSRRMFTSSLPKSYEKIGVIFTVPEDILFNRLHKRAAETGKTIPEFVVKDMIARYIPPEEGEFSAIIQVIGE